MLGQASGIEHVCLEDGDGAARARALPGRVGCGLFPEADDQVVTVMKRLLVCVFALTAMVSVSSGCIEDGDPAPWPPMEEKGTSGKTSRIFGSGSVPDNESGFTNPAINDPQTVDAGADAGPDAGP
jgi:hypothetical protein